MTVFRGVTILYCDNHLLVAVKPSNMPSQPDASGDLDMLTLMRAYVKEAYEKPGEAFIGLVQRLDRPVGGVMVFARTSKAAARLSAQLRERAVERVYRAVVRGTPQEEARLTGLIPREGGAPQEAALCYRCIERKPPLALLAVSLETGRKHQIRVQLSQQGLPIWGDARYGGGKPGQQIALWAVRVGLSHPTLRTWMAFDAPLPKTPPWMDFYPPEAML